MGIIIHEPGADTTLPWVGPKGVTNEPVDAYSKVADLATAGTSMAATETIDGAVYGTLERLAIEVRVIPILGPGLARALTRAARNILRGGKSPSSSQQNQSQVHAAKTLHALAILVDATAFWIGDFAEATYNTFSQLTHTVMPVYVEKEVRPVRVKAQNALKLAQKDEKDIAGGLAEINSLAQLLPWQFNATTFPGGMRVWVGLFARLWHEVYNKLVLEVGRIEGVEIPTLRGLLLKLSNFVHGSLVPDIQKLKAEMLRTLTQTIPAIKAKQAADERAIDKINNTTIPAVQAKQKADEVTIGQILLNLAPLIGLGTAAGFASAFGNAANSAPNASTAICDPVSECAGNRVLGKNGWSWLKSLLPAILAGAIDALLLADMCVICKAAATLVGVVEPELRAIAVIENGLASIGCASAPSPLPPPAYS